MLTLNLECFNEAQYMSEQKDSDTDLPYRQVAKVCSSTISLRKNKAVTIDTVLQSNDNPKQKLIKVLELSDLKYELCSGVNTSGFGWSIYLPLFTFLPRDTIATKDSGNGISVNNIGSQHNITMQKLVFDLPIYNISQAILIKFINSLVFYKLEFDTKINGFNSRYGINLAHGITFEICGPAQTVLNYSFLISLFTVSGPVSDISDKNSVYAKLLKNIFSFSNPRFTNFLFGHSIGIGNEYVKYQIGSTSVFIKLLQSNNRAEQQYFCQSLEFNLKTIYNLFCEKVINNK